LKSDDDEVEKVKNLFPYRTESRDETRRRLFVDSRKFPGAYYLTSNLTVISTLPESGWSNHFSVPIDYR
jgi:hypothetical protein